MAKFKRFDSRNKKANQHKARTKMAYGEKKIHLVVNNKRTYYAEQA